MFYKHWKKLALALTGFFWASCDNTPTSPSSNTEEPSSSNSISPSSSSIQSSSTIPNSSSTPNSSSSKKISPKSSSSSTQSSSSQAVETKLSSILEQNEDLYGCPPVFCGDDPSSSSVVPPSSSSFFAEVVPLYGIPVVRSSSSSDINIIAVKYGIIDPRSSSSGAINCTKFDNSESISCDDGMTCTESSTETTQSKACTGDICPKYGVVIIKEKTYKCEDGKIYSEAEFKAKYDITEISRPATKYGIPYPNQDAKL